MTKDEFTRVMGSRPRDKYKAMALHLSALEKKNKSEDRSNNQEFYPYHMLLIY